MLSAKTKKKNGTVEVRVTFPAESFRRLEAIQAGAQSTLTEVIKDALRLYEAVLAEDGAGSTFHIKRAGGEIEPYEIFSSDG